MIRFLAALVFALAPVTLLAAVTTLPPTVTITGTLGETIDTQSTQTGMPFTLSLVPPFANAALKGATIYGHVANVQKAGQGTEPQMLLAFDRIVFADKHSKPIHAQLLKDQVVPDKSGKETNAVVRGIGTVLGPAHGLGATLLSKNHKDDVHVPQGSKMIVELTQSLKL